MDQIPAITYWFELFTMTNWFSRQWTWMTYTYLRNQYLLDDLHGTIGFFTFDRQNILTWLENEELSEGTFIPLRHCIPIRDTALEYARILTRPLPNLDDHPLNHYPILFHLWSTVRYLTTESSEAVRSTVDELLVVALNHPNGDPTIENAAMAVYRLYTTSFQACLNYISTHPHIHTLGYLAPILTEDRIIAKAEARHEEDMSILIPEPSALLGEHREDVLFARVTMDDIIHTRQRMDTIYHQWEIHTMHMLQESLKIASTAYANHIHIQQNRQEWMVDWIRWLFLLEGITIHPFPLLNTDELHNLLSRVTQRARQMMIQCMSMDIEFHIGPHGVLIAEDIDSMPLFLLDNQALQAFTHGYLTFENHTLMTYMKYGGKTMIPLIPCPGETFADVVTYYLSDECLHRQIEWTIAMLPSTDAWKSLQTWAEKPLANGILPDMKFPIVSPRAHQLQTYATDILHLWSTPEQKISYQTSMQSTFPTHLQGSPRVYLRTSCPLLFNGVLSRFCTWRSYLSKIYWIRYSNKYLYYSH